MTDHYSASIAVANFFDDSHNRDVLERMREAGLTITDMPRQRSQPLKDITFVFTDSLERFTRDEAKVQVESLEGRATSSVNSETDYLMVGTAPGSKLGEAKKLDIPQLDESKFPELLPQQ